MYTITTELLIIKAVVTEALTASSVVYSAHLKKAQSEVSNPPVVLLGESALADCSLGG